MWVLIFFAGATAISMPFYRRTSAAFRERADAFFERLHTPVDFRNEIGEARDFAQLILMGNTCLIASALLCALYFLVYAWWEAGCVTFLVGFALVIGILLRLGAAREKRSYEALLEQEEGGTRG